MFVDYVDSRGSLENGDGQRTVIGERMKARSKEGGEEMTFQKNKTG